MEDNVLTIVYREEESNAMRGGGRLYCIINISHSIITISPNKPDSIGL